MMLYKLMHACWVNYICDMFTYMGGNVCTWLYVIVYIQYVFYLSLFSSHAVVCNPPCANGVCIANDSCYCPGFSGPTCSIPG